MTTELPEEPMSRKELYLADIAGQSVTLPAEPKSREEQYLAYIAEHGGGGGGGGDITDITVAGTSVKDGTVGKIPASSTTTYGAVKMGTLTQAQYDALVAGGTVDSETYYLIKE